MSQILREDLETIANYNLPWQDMRNSNVLITGATGLIGSMLIRSLNRVNQKHKLNLTILAVVRNIKSAEAILNDCNVQFIAQDIREPFTIKENIDYIIHCAAVTKSKEMVLFPVENIQTAVLGTENILQLAKNMKVKSIVYLSSMEVYGVTDPSLEKVTEEDLGYIDLKSPRSSYSESKRMCENMCNCYYFEYDLPVKIARLAQTFGAGVSKEDTRVFSQFAKSAIEGLDIVLHTDGSSTGNYCYTADAIKGILLLLLKGVDGEAYNISNEETNMTIRQMAELVAEKIAGGKISVITDIPESSLSHGYAPTVKMKLCSDKIRKLGWIPTIGLEDMYHKMIGGFKNDK